MNEIENFENNPILRDLLVKYVLRMYEGDAMTDDDQLYMEYQLLLKENRLNDLFIEEYLLNCYRNGENNRR